MAAYHAQNGRLGGLVGGATTLAIYGQEHFREIGRRGGLRGCGGRPTWAETLKKDDLSRSEANKRARQRNNVEPF